jgi:hypothetical protein
MPDCTLRFVVGTREKHSLSWKIRIHSKVDGAEIYLMPREISNDYHVSLHKSGNWHVRVGEGEARARGFEPDDLRGPLWKRPKELALGVTLAFRIVVTSASISRTHPVSKAGSTTFIPPPSEGRSIELSVVLTSGPPTEDHWPGKNSMGTGLVGWCAIDSEFISVVWREVDTPQGQQIPLNVSAAKRLLEKIPEGGGIGVMLWMLDEEQTPYLLLGRFDEESAERFRQRWEETAEEDELAS